MMGVKEARQENGLSPGSSNPCCSVFPVSQNPTSPQISVWNWSEDYHCNCSKEQKDEDNIGNDLKLMFFLAVLRL
jgi:hypothetical protein